MLTAHSGNYLFFDDGGLALLNFGCVKYLSADFSRQIAALMNGILKKADSAVLGVYTYLHGRSRDPIYFDRNYMGIQPLLKKMGAVVNTKNAWVG